MEKVETEVQEVHMFNGEAANIFRVLVNPDAVKILYCAGDGIGNSTYAMEELGLSQKRYYTRMTALLDANLIRKKDGVYRQTALGRIVYGRFLPAMGRAVDAKDELELIMELEGTELENDVKKRILEELGIPDFSDSTNVKLIDNYESMVVDVIDLCDEAKESVLMASNYFDVRVMEANLRSMDRGVKYRCIMGKSSLSSKMQKLRMMLSVTFAKTIINFASNVVDLKDFVRLAGLPYSFCIVDGHHNIIEISDTLNDSFVAALSVDAMNVGERLTKYFETLWEADEFQSAAEALNSIRSN